MTSLQDKIIRKISNLNDFCESKITKNPQKELLIFELLPNNEYGREKICLLAYEDHITLSYDYYEKRHDLERISVDETLEKIIHIIIKIFKEQLIAVTTYSTSLNATRVSNLYEPSEAKKIRRSKNFRARSWAGTYDDDCCT